MFAARSEGTGEGTAASADVAEAKAGVAEAKAGVAEAARPTGPAATVTNAKAHAAAGVRQFLISGLPLLRGRAPFVGLCSNEAGTRCVPVKAA